MIADRFEIIDDGHLTIAIRHGANTLYIDELEDEFAVAAIRQQARDIAELEVFAEIGHQWNADSSLAKWFPLTAERVERDAQEIAKLRTDLAAAVAKRDEWAGGAARLSSQLGNLLAVIHRDGGHYESEHGTEKACADAELAVHVQRGIADGYHGALKIWRQRAEQSEARLAAIDAAPTVGWLRPYGRGLSTSEPSGERMPQYELIARPAKD